MFTPLPYDRPDQLVMIWNAARPGDMTHLSLQEVVSYRDDSTTFLASVATSRRMSTSRVATTPNACARQS